MLRGFLIALLLMVGMSDVSVLRTQPRSAPHAVAHDIPAGSHFSRNWSGYIAKHDSFTAVGATWQIPTVRDTSAEYAADATWVGIGGSSSDDLLQAGSQAIVDRGSITYEAWVEFLPGYLQVIPLRVHEGDRVRVSLSEVEPALWRLQFENLTTGASFTNSYEYASSHSSAEWIEEAPMQSDGDLIPLDNFDSVTFTDAYAVGIHGTSTPQDLSAQAITMVDENTIPLSVPSSLVGDTFSVGRDTIAL